MEWWAHLSLLFIILESPREGHEKGTETRGSKFYEIFFSAWIFWKAVKGLRGTIKDCHVEVSQLWSVGLRLVFESRVKTVIWESRPNVGMQLNFGSWFTLRKCTFSTYGGGLKITIRLMGHTPLSTNSPFLPVYYIF